MEWEFGVSSCKLLFIEWINNKVLLYNTGNFIQYSMINRNGKEYFFKKLMTSTTILFAHSFVAQEFRKSSAR